MFAAKFLPGTCINRPTECLDRTSGFNEMSTIFKPQPLPDMFVFVRKKALVKLQLMQLIIVI